VISTIPPCKGSKLRDDYTIIPLLNLIESATFAVPSQARYAKITMCNESVSRKSDEENAGGSTTS
jgi:hypothetical protein